MANLIIALLVQPECPTGLLVSEFGCIDVITCNAHRLQILSGMACVRNCSQIHPLNFRLCDKYCVFPHVKSQWATNPQCLLSTDMMGAFFKNGEVVQGCVTLDYAFKLGNNRICMDYSLQYDILPAISNKTTTVACNQNLLEFHPQILGTCPDFQFLPQGLDFLTVQPSQTSDALKQCPNTLICLKSCPSETAALGTACELFDQDRELYIINGKFVSGCGALLKDDGICVSRCRTGFCANEQGICVSVPVNMFIGTTGYCVNNCLSLIEEQQCITQCSEGYGVDSATSSVQCVSSSVGKFLQNQSWVSSCQPLLHQNDRCVQQCSEGYGVLQSSGKCTDESSTLFYLENHVFKQQCSPNMKISGRRCVSTCPEPLAVLDKKQCRSSSQLVSEQFFIWDGMQVVNELGNWAQTCNSLYQERFSCQSECNSGRAVLAGTSICTSDDTGSWMIMNGMWVSNCIPGLYEEGKYCRTVCSEGFGHSPGQFVCRQPSSGEIIDDITKEIATTCANTIEKRFAAQYCVSDCSSHHGMILGGTECLDTANQPDQSLFLHGNQWNPSACTMYVYNRECMSQCPHGTGVVATDLFPKQCYATHSQLILDVQNKQFVAQCHNQQFFLSNSSGKFCLMRCEGEFGYFSSSTCCTQPVGMYAKNGMWVASCDPTELVQDGWKCVSACQEGYRLFNGECILNTSIQGCKAHSDNFISAGSCAKSCGAGLAVWTVQQECVPNPGGLFKHNNTWVSSCGVLLYYKDVCYNKCPPDTALNGTSLRCYDRSEIYQAASLAPFVALNTRWEYVCRSTQFFYHGECIDICPPGSQASGITCTPCGSQFYYPDSGTCSPTCAASYYIEGTQCLGTCGPHYYSGQQCASSCTGTSDQFYETISGKKHCVSSCSIYSQTECVLSCENGQFINETGGTVKCVYNCTSNIFEVRGGQYYCVEAVNCVNMTFIHNLQMYQCIPSCEFALQTKISGVTVCFPYIPVNKYFFVNAGQKILVDACQQFSVIATRECVASCPPYLFAKNRFCESFCDEFVIQTLVAGVLQSRECVPVCPASAPYHDVSKLCISACNGYLMPDGLCTESCQAFDGQTCLLAGDAFEAWSSPRKTWQCQGLHSSYLYPSCQMNGVVWDYAGQTIVNVNKFSRDGNVYYVMDVNNSHISRLHLYLEAPNLPASAGDQLSVFRRVHNSTFSQVHIWGVVSNNSATVYLVLSGSNVLFTDSRFSLNSQTQYCAQCTGDIFLLTAAPLFDSYVTKTVTLYTKSYRILASPTETIDSIVNRTRFALNLSFNQRMSKLACFEQGDQFCYLSTDGVTHEVVLCHGTLCQYHSLPNLVNYAFGLSCNAYRLGFECVANCPPDYISFRGLCLLHCPAGYERDAESCQKQQPAGKTVCPVGYNLMVGQCVHDDGTAPLARPPCVSQVQQGWTCVSNCVGSQAQLTPYGSFCKLCSDFYQVVTGTCVTAGTTCVAGSVVCPLRCAADSAFSNASFACIPQHKQHQYMQISPDFQCSASQGSGQTLNAQLYCVHACSEALVAQSASGGVFCQNSCAASFFQDKYGQCLAECPLVAENLQNRLKCADKCQLGHYLTGKLCVSSCAAPLFQHDKPDFSGVFEEVFTPANYTGYLGLILTKYGVSGQCSDKCSGATAVYNLTACSTRKIDCIRVCQPNCAFVSRATDGFQCLWPGEVSADIDGTQFFQEEEINGLPYFNKQTVCAAARRINRENSSAVNFAQCVDTCPQGEVHEFTPLSIKSPVKCIQACGGGNVINKRSQAVGGSSITGYFCDANTAFYAGNNFLSYHEAQTAPTGVAGWYSGEKCVQSRSVVYLKGAYYWCRKMDAIQPYNNIFSNQKVQQTKNCVQDCEQYFLLHECPFSSNNRQFLERRVDEASSIVFFVCKVGQCPPDLSRMYQYTQPLNSQHVECFANCNGATIQAISHSTNLMVNGSGFCVPYLIGDCQAFRTVQRGGLIVERFCDKACGSGSLSSYPFEFFDNARQNKHCAASCQELNALFPGQRFIRRQGACFEDGPSTMAQCDSLTVNATDTYCFSAAECPAAISDKFFEFYPMKHCTNCPIGLYGVEGVVFCMAECPAGSLADELLGICVPNNEGLQWRSVEGIMKRNYNCADLSATDQLKHLTCCRGQEFITAQNQCISAASQKPDVYNPGPCDAYRQNPKGATYPKICVNCTTALERDMQGFYQCVTQCSGGWTRFDPDSRCCLDDTYVRRYSVASESVEGAPIKQNLHIQEVWFFAAACAVLLLLLSSVLAKVLRDWWLLVHPVRFVDMRVPGLAVPGSSGLSDQFVIPTDITLE